MKKYISPESDVSLIWDDPLTQSQGGEFTTPDDEFTTNGG